MSSLFKACSKAHAELSPGHQPYCTRADRQGNMVHGALCVEQGPESTPHLFAGGLSLVLDLWAAWRWKYCLILARKPESPVLSSESDESADECL